MTFHKLIVYAGILLIGMLGAVNSWADDITQCSQSFDARKYDQAFPVCNKAAARGDAGTQEVLAAMYELGLGVEKSYVKAAKWYHKAAEQGHAPSQNALGDMYYTGRGVKQDYAKALKWYRTAAEKGFTDAQMSLGNMYEVGNGVKKSHLEMIKWYRQAGEGGDMVAQQILGKMYDKGLGVKKNLAKAVKWYRKAAAPSYAEGEVQFRLGEMYEFGEGVKQDYTEAVKWYGKAPRMYNFKAQFRLGVMYEIGKGVKQNYDVAKRFYSMAAERGYAKAQLNLGTMYYKGLGTPYYKGRYLAKQDDAKAVKWFRKAAEQGNPDAQFKLGAMYATGRGVLQSATAATDWYYKAGLSFLKQGKRDDALTSVGRIKKQGNVPNAFLGNKLLALIYGGNETAKISPKTKQKKTARAVSGTGWPTVGGYVVTNHHVVAGHHHIMLLRRDGKLIKASVAIDDATNDLVLLKPESMEYMPPSLPLADHPAIVGEKVFTIGYPHPDLMGAEPKLTQGIINARTGMRNDPRVYQVSVPIQSGNSGGPLLNMRGEVVGVTTSKISVIKVFKWTGDMPQNVNYAVKSGYIRTLLSSAGSGTKVSVLPVKSAKLSDLAQRIEGSVLMIIAK